MWTQRYHSTTRLVFDSLFSIHIFGKLSTVLQSSVTFAFTLLHSSAASLISLRGVDLGAALQLLPAVPPGEDVAHLPSRAVLTLTKDKSYPIIEVKTLYIAFLRVHCVHCTLYMQYIHDLLLKALGKKCYQARISPVKIED